MAKETFIRNKPHVNSSTVGLEIRNLILSIPEIEISALGQFEAMNGHFISNSNDRQAIAYILQLIAGSPLLKTNLQQEVRHAQESKTIIGGFKTMSGMDSE